MDFNKHFNNHVDLINSTLSSLIEANGIVSEAMRYSLLSGGKRIRGSLVLSVCEMLEGDRDAAIRAACSVEMLHCYSLIHDDLPCMDDDDFRRGKPSCHKQYSEAIALLAGDGLLTEAFYQLSSIPNHEISAKCSSLLSSAAGYRGMILGQELDLRGIDTEKEISSQLDIINKNKTGKLITTSLMMGATCSHCDDEEVQRALKEYGDNLGLVFQIVDDILDVTSSFEVLGKNSGSDANNNKVTYCSVYGIEESSKIASELTDHCIESINRIDSSGYFEWFAKTMLNRNK